MAEIENRNTKGKYHGYQEWHIWHIFNSINDKNKDKVWFRGNVNNGQNFGYVEINLEDNNCIGQKGTTLNFYII